MEEYLIITDTMVCTGCCATLDHIVTYLFKKVTNKVGKKVRGSQTSAENDPLVAVIKVAIFVVDFLDFCLLPDETGDPSADVADSVEHHHV